MEDTPKLSDTESTSPTISIASQIQTTIPSFNDSPIQPQSLTQNTPLFLLRHPYHRFSFQDSIASSLTYESVSTTSYSDIESSWDYECDLDDDERIMEEVTDLYGELGNYIYFGICKSRELISISSGHLLPIAILDSYFMQPNALYDILPPIQQIFPYIRSSLNFTMLKVVLDIYFDYLLQFDGPEYGNLEKYCIPAHLQIYAAVDMINELNNEIWNLKNESIGVVPIIIKNTREDYIEYYQSALINLRRKVTKMVDSFKVQ